MPTITRRLFPVVSSMLAGALLVTGCSRAEPDWTVQESPADLYSVELPGEPDEQSQDVPNAGGEPLTLQTWTVELGDDAYTVSEVQLPPGTPFDLDAGVQGSVDSMLASVESQTGDSGEINIASTETSDFGGTDARTYTGNLRVGDIDATFRGLSFVAEDVLVQFVSIDSDNDNNEIVDRFFSSITP